MWTVKRWPGNHCQSRRKNTGHPQSQSWAKTIKPCLFQQTSFYFLPEDISIEVLHGLLIACSASTLNSNKKWSHTKDSLELGGRFMSPNPFKLSQRKEPSAAARAVPSDPSLLWIQQNSTGGTFVPEKGFFSQQRRDMRKSNLSSDHNCGRLASFKCIPAFTGSITSHIHKSQTNETSRTYTIQDTIQIYLCVYLYLYAYAYLGVPSTVCTCTHTILQFLGTNYSSLNIWCYQRYTAH